MNWEPWTGCYQISDGYATCFATDFFLPEADAWRGEVWAMIRERYHAHKAEYQEANGQFEALIQDLIFKIGETDGSILHNAPKDLTFKLVRDTRFSHDKSPYNPAFRAHIAARGKLPVPVGYYLMIKPGNQSFLGAARRI